MFRLGLYGRASNFDPGCDVVVIGSRKTSLGRSLGKLVDLLEYCLACIHVGQHGGKLAEDIGQPYEDGRM